MHGLKEAFAREVHRDEAVKSDLGFYGLVVAPVVDESTLREVYVVLYGFALL